MQSLSYVGPSTWHKLPNNLKTATSLNWITHDIKKCFFSDTHMEELDSVQEFNEIQGCLLLTFSICLHNQLSSFNSIIAQMSEKHDSLSGQ